MYPLDNYGYETVKILRILAGVWIGLSVYLVWNESCKSDQRQFLKRECDKEEASSTMNTLFGTKPEILVKTTSFHRQRRDKKTIKVITHRDCEVFEYSTYNDISDVEKMPVLDGNGVTLMELNLAVLLADKETKDALEAKKKQMVEKNKHLDTCIEVYVEDNLSNFKNHFMIGDDNDGTPCWMNSCCFYLAAIFWCPWPFRLLLKAKTKRKDFVYIKEISIKPNAFSNPMCTPTAPVYGDTPQSGIPGLASSRSTDQIVGSSDEAVRADTVSENAPGVTVRYYVKNGQEIRSDQTYILKTDLGHKFSLSTPYSVNSANNLNDTPNNMHSANGIPNAVHLPSYANDIPNAMHQPNNASNISYAVYPPNNANYVPNAMHLPPNAMYPPNNTNYIPNAMYPPNNAPNINTPYVVYSVNNSGYISSNLGEPEEAPPSYDSVTIGNRNTSA